MPKPPTLLVISFFDARPAAALAALLRSLRRRTAGAPYEIVIVANRTAAAPLALPEEAAGVRVLERANEGMNIAAWEHGWRQSPGFDRIVFLQDDCRIVRAGWLAAFAAALDNPAIGLVGESLNSAWDAPWDALRARHTDALPGHGDGPRADFYRACMARWGVDPGSTGRHLRSLVWAARREVLERIGGFPVGRTYGECIAAEIAVSRKVEAAGLRIDQVDRRPFRYIAHAEWRRPHPFARHRHLSMPA
ncbi:MAG: hypothetical protein AB7L26_13365 [Hyphomonadaceae bacterium]